MFELASLARTVFGILVAGVMAATFGVLTLYATITSPW